MKSEDDPITDDEWLLRHVRKERFRTDEVPLVSPTALEPRLKARNPDTDGISFFRAACLADPVEILAGVSADRRREYGIVKVSAGFLNTIHLTVKNKPGEIKGHVVVPELNAIDYQRNKARF